MKSPWMPFYVGDYLRDTMHLTPELHGAYLLLILNYWTRGGLPDDDAYLARVSGLMANAWQTHRQTLAEFFEVRDGQWIHKRIEHELAKSARVQEKRKTAGKAGALARWDGKRIANASESHRQRHSKGNADAMQTHWQNDGQPQSHKNGDINNKAVESPLECPAGFPKTLTEAKAHAAFVGCSDEFAEKTWHKAVSRGYLDGRGIPIRNWRSFLTIELKYERERLQRTHATRQHTSATGSNRSDGTANEGRADDYAGLG